MSEELARDMARDVGLRRARACDLDAVLAIKRGLPMPGGHETTSGGFLLGGDREAYVQLLLLARIWLLEIDGDAVGFTVTLDDPILRASPLWSRREAIEWEAGFDPTAHLERRVGYFDQLAVLPRARQRYWGAALALRALAELIDEAGHELVLTTTVIEPIVNRAALPYLARVGAREVGRLPEHYPGVGPIVSALHLIEAGDYRDRVAALAAMGPRRPGTQQILATSADSLRDAGAQESWSR